MILIIIISFLLIGAFLYLKYKKYLEDKRTYEVWKSMEQMYDFCINHDIEYKKMFK